MKRTITLFAFALILIAANCSQQKPAITCPVRSFNNNGGEIVDARAFVSGWNSPSFDDSQWAYAAAAAGNDSVSLEAHDIAPSRVIETFVKIATLLGKPDDAALYGKRLAALRPAIHAEFYDPKTGNYCDGNHVQQAFAVIAGVAKDDVRTQAEASIIDNMRNEKKYFDMGSSGLVVLLHYLAEHPETAGLAASILNKTEFPGYGYFIEQGETTWPEDWKINVPSKIHTASPASPDGSPKAFAVFNPTKRTPDTNILS